MIRRPPRSTQGVSSAASDVYKRQHQQVLLAKNREGYDNLTYLSSIAYTEGLYGQYARIDKDLIHKHRKNIIALSGNLNGIIPQLILNTGIEAAENELKWWMDTFGDDFYLELNLSLIHI